MTGLAAQDSSRYLCVLRALRSSCRFYDIHVHPYEILFDRFSYQDDPTPGVASLEGKSYQPPSVSPHFSFPEMAQFNDEARSQRLREISVMLLRKVYGSVGERVFLDQMELGAMDKVLLLPAAADSGGVARFDSRMRWVTRVYGNRDKFWIAGSIPPELGGAEIGAYAAALRAQYGIRAMKCHPVVSGIDLGSAAGRQWLELMLAACRELQLPLLLHAGRNNPYWGGSRGNFGSLEHLREINFSQAREPVILAHAGLHRCSMQEIRQEGLPMLQRMLRRHANLYVDISGIGFEPLKLVLQAVDGDRILFGSDALYVPQWEAVTMTMHALKELGMKVEERFVQFASINPNEIIFKEGLPC